MSSDEESEFIDILETNRFEIVQRLQADRTFLFDYLRSKNVFDSGDYDLVLAEKTRERKAGKFLDILMTKSRNAYNHFLDALQVSNPGLFEKLTGEKSTSRPNPITMDKENFLVDNGTRILDLDIMSNRLNLTTQGLQEMTLRHDQVLKSNQELSKALQETRYELEEKTKRVKHLENQIQDVEAKILEVQTNSQRAQDSFVQQLNAEKERINENNTFIIALQMKLLDYKEQIDGLEKTNRELSSQNECLKGKLNAVCRHYEDERRQSMRLTERLETQKGDIERVQETKRKCRELTFQNQQLLKERDDIAEELEQLKNWTEALKVRYDIVKQEKDETLENHETVVADCSNLRDQSYQLEYTINQAKRRGEDLAKLNNDLEQAVKSYKKQRDLCEQARKEAIMERDQVKIERDEYQQRYQEVVNSRDAKINRHMEETKKFEKLYEEARKELKVMRGRFEDAENSKQLLLNQLTLVSELAEQPRGTPVTSSPNPHVEDGGKDVRVPLSHDNNQGEVEGYNWKLRRTKDVIDSLKKRIQPGCTSYRSQSSSESSGSSINLEREIGLDERIAAILPQFDNLSPQTKENVSMQRNLPVKKLMTFDIIATMCPSLNNGSTSPPVGNITDFSQPSAVTGYTSTQRSEREIKYPPPNRSGDSSKGSDELDGDFRSTPNMLEPENSLRRPYKKKFLTTQAALKSTNEDRDSGRASSVASDSDRSEVTKISADSDENGGERTEVDQQLGRKRNHRKLSKQGANKAYLLVKEKDPEKQGESSSDLTVNNKVENGGECFDFGDAANYLRADSVTNESEASLEEVKNALLSPSIRTAQFRGRTRRLSDEDLRPRSKTD